MVQQKYQRQLIRPVRRDPAGIAQRQALASIVSDLVPSYSALLHPPRPIRKPQFISRWPKPMDLDHSSGIISLSPHLESSSWWLEPVDLDTSGLLTFIPLDIKFDLPQSMART